MTVYINGVGGGASAVEVRTEMDSNSTRLSAIEADTTGIAGSAMRGTDGANTTTPPTVAQVRTEMDSNSTRLSAIETDTAGIGGDAMRGTNSAALATTALSDAVWTNAKAAFVDASVAAIPTTAMRGTDSAALASVCTDARLAHLTQDVAVCVKKGVQYTAVFKMVDATDFATPETGITVTETISKDGGAFAACTNAFSEIANGWYKIVLTATEMNAAEIILKCTGAGCAQSDRMILTSA